MQLDTHEGEFGVCLAENANGVVARPAPTGESCTEDLFNLLCELLTTNGGAAERFTGNAVATRASSLDVWKQVENGAFHGVRTHEPDQLSGRVFATS